MDLKNKTVLITGAARRIGREIALGFAEQGAQVLVHYKESQEDAESLLAELKEKGVSSSAYQADLLDVDSLDKMTRKVLRDCETIDVLVNNASNFFPTPFKTTTSAHWDEFMGLHVKAPFFLAQQLAPAMKKKGEGRIINMADWTGLKIQKNYLVYGTSKAALLAMTRGLAKELAPEVLVNCICPGPILPPLGMDEAEQKQVAQKTLLKRWGSPEDLVRQVVFLATQDFATGAQYVVDGGQSLV